jgi:hypothetical protein
VIYEGTLSEGRTDPWGAHLKRIYERVEDWANQKGEQKLIRKRIRVNGVEGNFLELMEILARHQDHLICRYKTVILGDEHLKNVMVSLSPPGSCVIFFDLPNVVLNGDDPGKGWGKGIHWYKVYGNIIQELNSCSLKGEELDKRVKEALKLVIKEDAETIEISYELTPMPLAEKLQKVFETIVNDFATRHNDLQWRLRAIAGWARADFGAMIHQRSKYLSIVLFAEGMKRLIELCKLVKEKTRREDEL